MKKVAILCACLVASGVCGRQEVSVAPDLQGGDEISPSSTGDGEGRLFQLDLLSTAHFLRKRRRRLHQRRNSTNNYYESGFYNKRGNAVYAPIPDTSDPDFVDDAHLQAFHTFRHLSRYEQQYRIERKLDSQSTWDGCYNYTDLEHYTTDSFAAPRVGRTIVNARTNATRDMQRQLQGDGFYQTVHGGQFDHYQAVPLSQGYGSHYSSVWVGSPVPQRRTAIVDTGSHFTAFPCTGCRGCGGTHHTDPYFNPAKSSTFRQLQCDECRDNVSCQNSQCKFTQSYTEGSSWEAVQVRDRFYCGGSDVLESAAPKDERYAIDFMFGCQTSMTGLFITQLADGIMGMSAHPATLPKQLFDKRIIEHNMFALCYRRELGTSKSGVSAGSLTLGGVSNSLDTSPIVWARNMAKIGWYTVYVKNIYIRQGGGQSARSTDPNHKTIKVNIVPGKLNSGKGVIVDSGTTDTYLNKAIAPAFNRAWKRATGRAYSHAPMKLSQEKLSSLPTILIQCHAASHKHHPSMSDYDNIPGYAGKLDPSAPQDLLIAVPATSYMDYSVTTQMYTSRLYFTETAGGVLGSNTMQGHNVVFDWENGRIGFAESSCTYDKKGVPVSAQEDEFSTDCSTSNPILTMPCTKTVDATLCRHNPTNVAVLGREIWTAVVLDPGTDQGVSCVQSTQGSMSRSAFDTPNVTCGGKGTCEERRYCQLTCQQLLDAQKVQKVLDFKAQSKCGDSLWSACDYNCAQTRIFSTAYTDGTCRETSRQMRPCHVEACARADPCRVPFLVHLALGFRGGAIEHWSALAEDALSEAVVKAAHRIHPDASFLVPGDVNVKVAVPWNIRDDGSTSQAGYEVDIVGIRAVMEISVFNSQADHKNISEIPDDFGPETASSLSRLWHNMTARFDVNGPLVKCRSAELFKLAKRTQRLKNLFAETAYTEAVLNQLLQLSDEQEDAVRPFGSSFQDPTMRAQSKLISVWSVRTQMDDPINYFGPPRPIWHRLLSWLHLGLTVCMVLFVSTSAWSMLWTCTQQRRPGVPVPVRFSIPFNRFLFRYLPLRQNEEDNELYIDHDEETIMGRQGTGAGEVELSAVRQGRGTLVKKRRNTTSFMSDDSDR